MNKNKVIRIINNIKYSLIWQVDNIISSANTVKDYYVIRRFPPGAGFFSNWFYYLYHSMYAHRHSMNPVIDGKTYISMYNSGNINWINQYYQGHDICSVRKTKKYVLSDNIIINNYLPFSYSKNKQDIVIDINMLNELHILSKEVFKLNDYMRNQFFEEQRMHEIKYNQTMAVHIRQTDKTRYNKDHQMAVSLEEYIKEVDLILLEKKIKKIYLATDSLHAYNAFSERYRDYLIPTQRLRSEYDALHLSPSTKVDYKFRIGEDVLLDALHMSHCSYFLHSNSNVAMACIVMSNDSFSKRKYLS